MEKTTNTKHSTLAEKGLSGFIWTFVGTGGQAIFQLATLAVLARLLTPVEFGVIGTAIVITQFSNIFSELGVGPAIVQRQTLTPSHLQVGFTISLIFGLIVALIIYLTAEYAANFFRTPDLQFVLKVYSVLFVLSGFSVVSESLLLRQLKFKAVNCIELLSYLFGYATVGITMALNGFGFWSLVGAHTAQSLVKAIALILSSPPIFKLSLNKRILFDFLNFGTGLTLGRIANYLANQGDNLVIGRTLGADALGSYGRAYQLVVMPANLFGQVFEKVLFPTLSRSQDDKPALATAYRKSTSLITWILIPFSAFLWEITPELITLVLGSQWLNLIWPFRILSIGITFRVIHKISDAIVRSLGAVYKRAWVQACYAILVITGAWFGHFYGIVGVSACVCVAIIINYLLMSALCLSLTNLAKLDFIKAHFPGINLGIASYIIMNLYKNQLAHYDYTTFSRIIFCSLTLAIMYIVVGVKNIKPFIGNDNSNTLLSILSQTGVMK